MTIATMTWRSLSRGWRPLLLLLLPLAGLGLSVLLRFAVGEADEVVADQVVRDLATSVIIPLAALLVAVNGIGNEVDDSSVLHVLATPTPRWQILLQKVLVICAVSALLGLVTAGGMAAVMGSHELTSWLVAGAVAGLAYGAVFTALSTWVKHAVIIGALYLVLWEGMLIGLAPRARFLSLHHGALAVAQHFRDRDALVELTDLSATGGVMVLGVAALGGLLLAWWALSRMRLAKGS
ncbi:ABC transporter permease subunit [Kytococcus sp. Marseille-QA3725]